MSARDDCLQGLLSDALAMAVQLEIMRLRDATPEQRDALAASLRYPENKEKKGTPEYRAEEARLSALPFSGYPLGGADVMLYGGKGARESLAAWAKAIALLAFAPGGIRFGSLGFCAAHPAAKWPESEAACPACLDAEMTAKGRAS